MGSGRRRRSATNELVTIYWRDIPAQVTAVCDGQKGSWLLDQRFQVAIDAAATVAELTDADDYVLEWRRVSTPCQGDPQAAAETEAARLEAAYPPPRVRALVTNGGLDPNPDPQTPASPPHASSAPTAQPEKVEP